MRTDLTIQKDIISRLHDEPLLNAADIGVAVRNGVAALSGEVASSEQKNTVEEVARKTEGVRAISVAIQVGPSPVGQRSDWELADAVAGALQWHTVIHDRLVWIRVEKGIVTLQGCVDFSFQRRAAVEALHELLGDGRINDCISLKQPLTSAEAGRLVKEALASHPALDVSTIKVDMAGAKAILTGVVYSAAERAEVESATRKLAGVITVDNKITLIREQQVQNV